MSRQSTFAEHLQANRVGRAELYSTVRPKPMNLPADQEERSRVIRETARRVIERHRDELERLAHK